MPEVTITLVLSSLVAGIFMFLAPCTLPLLPAFLAFISGVKNDEVDNPHFRLKVIMNAIAFTSGFTIIFVSFGMLAGFFGSFVGSFKGELTQIGGIFILLFGFMMLGLFKFKPLLQNYQIKTPSFFVPGEPSSAFLVGSIFALGWTPCVGPVLASVLLLAATSTTVLQGGLLLLVFSLGLAIPFLLLAVLYVKASDLIYKYSYLTVVINKIGAIFLIILGVLLLTDNFGLTVEYGYRLFYWFGLSGLFELF